MEMADRQTALHRRKAEISTAPGEDMSKEKISVTIDATVLAAVDADAKVAGVDRSEMIERALRNAASTSCSAQLHRPSRPSAENRRICRRSV